MQVELKGIQHEVGITYIFVTHYQEEALTISDRIAVFDYGQIVQIGSPSELYERPRTKFVAGFVGTSNILSGETAAAITNSPQSISIRPEKIRLASLDSAVPDGYCTIEGVVQDIVYLGMNTRYLVQLDSGQTMIVIAQNIEVRTNNGTAERGNRVRLLWPEKANNLLEDEA
jgi:putative spermidine/putrescine transport system ATP-binding protein